jgi:hypothetical protein
MIHAVPPAAIGNCGTMPASRSRVYSSGRAKGQLRLNGKVALSVLPSTPSMVTMHS